MVQGWFKNQLLKWSCKINFLEWSCINQLFMQLWLFPTFHGSGMFQGWSGDGSGMVRGWFSDGSGMVQWWFMLIVGCMLLMVACNLLIVVCILSIVVYSLPIWLWNFASFGSNCNYKFLNVSSKCTLAMIVCFMMTYTTSKRKAKPNSSSSVAESNRDES